MSRRKLMDADAKARIMRAGERPDSKTARTQWNRRGQSAADKNTAHGEARRSPRRSFGSACELPTAR